ncbi:hypothetical protein HK100_005538, partial [Physocladia obscura]
MGGKSHQLFLFTIFVLNSPLALLAIPLQQLIVSEPNSPKTDLQPPQYPRPSDHEPKRGSNLLSPIDPASKRAKSAALISSYFQSSSNATEPSSTLTNPPRNLTAPVYVVPAHQNLSNRNGHGGKRSGSGRKPK